VLGAAPDAKLSSADIAYASRKNVDEYRTTHFDQPNILAHLRVNDRTVDGKKTLFVEEIQSDWHQAGRKKGYAGENQKALLKNQTRLGEIDKILATAKYTPEEGSKLLYEQGQLAKEYGELEAKRARGGDVPDAPFKTSWHELSLKRAIQEAAEKGYDQIAFTTGKTQAERYDLSKQVKQVEVYKVDNGLYNVEIVDNNGRIVSVPDSRAVDAKRIEDIVGKEVAAKAVEQADKSGESVLTGLDLQVGGEGMKGFYDNILPKSLDKLGKKFGAKVGKTEMDGVEVWQMDITPQMRESVTTKGQPLFAIPAIGAGLLGAGMMQEEEQF
jgi:hypothetical protein